MKLGIGSYTYTWAIGVPGQSTENPLNPLELLSRAVELGVQVAQFCDNLPLTKLTPAELDEVSTFASTNKIAVELGTRGIDPANLLSHLHLARRFQAPFVRVVLDSKNCHPTPAEAISILRESIPTFSKIGVKIAIENHDRFTAATLVDIVEALGAEHVGICLDTVNSLGALEGPEVVVKTLAPYTLNLHVKDFTIERVSSQMGFVVAGCAAGDGRINVPWLLNELCAAGRDVNAILELWTPFGPTLAETIKREAEMAEKSIRYLRQFIQR